ncbi:MULTISPECIES: acyl carrier protein [unclassified Streptomyces]|uniref:acyl carrier protein n=1 Tax=unclassified Streptomyces TaxID=2593676 RepID=UPI0036E22115
MFEELKNILVADLKVDPEAVQPTATLEDTALDSLAIVELCLAVEQQLQVSISEDEIFAATTLGDLARLVEERSANV